MKQGNDKLFVYLGGIIYHRNNFCGKYSFIQIILLLWLCQTVNAENFETKCHPTFQLAELKDSVDNLVGIQPFLESLTFPQNNIFFVNGVPAVIVRQEVLTERSVTLYSKVMKDVCFRSVLLPYEPSPRDLFSITKMLNKHGIEEIVFVGILIGGEMVYRNSKRYSIYFWLYKYFR